jgi:hypothetical protein
LLRAVLEAWAIAKVVDEILSDAVAEVFRVGVGAHVDEA